jgi:hypothetical protein
MFEVVVEFFNKKDGAFAGMMRTALPYYFYNGSEIITDISSASLRKMIPSLPHEVHFLVRVAE